MGEGAGWEHTKNQEDNLYTSYRISNDGILSLHTACFLFVSVYVLIFPGAYNNTTENNPNVKNIVPPMAMAHHRHTIVQMDELLSFPKSLIVPKNLITNEKCKDILVISKFIIFFFFQRATELWMDELEETCGVIVKKGCVLATIPEDLQV